MALEQRTSKREATERTATNRKGKKTQRRKEKSKRKGVEGGRKG